MKETLELVYKCDHCKEEVKSKNDFFDGLDEKRNHIVFESRKYKTEFIISVYGGKELCVPCGKKAIIDIGQQFLTDKVRGKE